MDFIDGGMGLALHLVSPLPFYSFHFLGGHGCRQGYFPETGVGRQEEFGVRDAKICVGLVPGVFFTC